MKQLLIIMLLVFIVSACQKDNAQTAAISGNQITDKPTRKIDSSSHYSAVGDTAFYAGLICDTLRMYAHNPANLFLFQDTVLVIRYAPDSIHIINLVPHLLWTQDFFQIDSSNFYNSYNSFTFSNADSLIFFARWDNPCGNPMDDYWFGFNGKRYK